MRSSASSRWPSPGGGAVLAGDDVHVWQLVVDDSVDAAAAQAVLSPEECRRASRLVRESDRRAFRAVRAALRRLLGAYLGTDARTLRFSYGEHGKPRLADGPDRAPAFNVSHSGQLGMIAVTARRAVGIDVEQGLREVDWQGIAQRFFAPQECARLEGLAPAQQRREFFRYWTHKEAYVKACGRGLSLPLDRVVIDLDAPAGKRLGDRRSAGGPWFLCELEVPDGYHAALAVAGANLVVRRFNLPGQARGSA